MDDNYANGAPPPPEGQPQGGYCIEIYVGPDNQVQSVKAERKPAPPPMGDDKEFASSPDQEQSVGSIDDALEMARQIYEDGGQSAQPSGEDQEHADLMEGYGKGSYRAQRGGLPVRKVFRGDM